MPEHILPLPPKWERDVDCGWVVFESGADEIRGYFAKPKGGNDLPGIVMVHENLGIIEHRQDVTRRLAKAGYACLTVDLYSRIGGQSPRDFSSPQERRVKAFKAMPDEQVVPDLEAGLSYLRGRDDVDGSRIGAIGYCSGGGQLYGWACGNASELACAVVFYGSLEVGAEARPNGDPIDRIATAGRLQCPMQIHQGNADKVVPMDRAYAMVEGLKASGQPIEFFEYDGADHAYHDDTHPAYHADASEASWARTLAFFAQHLK